MSDEESEPDSPTPRAAAAKQPARRPTWKRPAVVLTALAALALVVAATIWIVSAQSDSTSSRPVTALPGKQPTIGDYLRQNGITETPVKGGDLNAPKLNFPYPPGWESAGARAPAWAYGGIVYAGPEAQKVAPSIIATLSRLTGHADPQQILDLAPGELQNLPGFAGGNGAKSQLGGYPAYQYGGSYAAPGGKRLVAQKTVVIRTGNGLYVLQIDADGIDGQQGVLEDATRFIDQNSTITP